MVFTNLSSGASNLRGKILEQNLKDRQRVTRKLQAHGTKRKEHDRKTKALIRDLDRLVAEARRLEPPMTQEEIARLTNVTQVHISSICRKTETPTQERHSA